MAEACTAKKLPTLLFLVTTDIDCWSSVGKGSRHSACGFHGQGEEHRKPLGLRCDRGHLSPSRGCSQDRSLSRPRWRPYRVVIRTGPKNLAPKQPTSSLGNRESCSIPSAHLALPIEKAFAVRMKTH